MESSEPPLDIKGVMLDALIELLVEKGVFTHNEFGTHLSHHVLKLSGIEPTEEK